LTVYKTLGDSVAVNSGLQLFDKNTYFFIDKQAEQALF